MANLSLGVKIYTIKQDVKNMNVKKTRFADEYIDEAARGAILNTDYPGFKEDYIVLHCLMRLSKAKSVFEIGTNMGKGTAIICNALPFADVYSLDLPFELVHRSLQHPINEGKGDNVGRFCKFPYTQIRADSMMFDYERQPCEAYYIDGEHTFTNVYHETTQVLKCNPKLIVWHDSDIPEVYDGIVKAFDDAKNGDKYELTRVEDTRIMYAKNKITIKKNK